MRKKLIILAFLIMITLPQISFWIINGNTEETSTTENRKLNAKPELKISTITEYPQKFDDYYNDHLPFRTELRSIWTKLNYQFFKTSIDAKVVFGKDGWLFYNNKEEKNIEQTQGILKFTDEQQKKILENLMLNNEKLQDKAIELYILVPPNKENVYREYLPDTIKIKNTETRTEELINYLSKNSDLKVIYPKAELIKQKERHQTYMKYDTHWNEFGALIGTIETQRVIDNAECFNITKSNIVEKNEKEDNDLATMIDLKNKLYENKIKVDNFFNDVKCEHKYENKCDIYETNSKNDQTILVIGDSYRLNMRQFLSKLYKKSVFVYTYDYDEKMLEEFKPDIVLFETLERYSNRLGEIKILSK